MAFYHNDTKYYTTYHQSTQYCKGLKYVPSGEFGGFTVNCTSAGTLTVMMVEVDTGMGIETATDSFTIETSTDGITWTPQTLPLTEQHSAGDKVYMRRVGDTFSHFTYYIRINYSAPHTVSGNILSLHYGSDYANYTTLPANSYYNFYGLLQNDSTLTDASMLILPENTKEECYAYMFQSCTSLVAPPQLPSTTLTLSCYEGMFSGCSALTTPPVLPATQMASSCYRKMFEYTGLTSAPVLSSTSLGEYCYSYMFRGCTSLYSAPALPATTLSLGCYYAMFEGCSWMYVAPNLFATTLVGNCYSRMFYGCSQVSYIRASFLTTPGSAYTEQWVYGVYSQTQGTFSKNADATWSLSGANGIPQGWAVLYHNPPQQ